MNTIKAENKGNVKFVAHRGLSGIEPENTLASFIGAANRSFWGIETDLHVTKDGKFILMHDYNTERMTGKMLIIGDENFDTLRALSIKDKDGKAGRVDLHMPSLDEYLDICKKYEKHVVLELKLPLEDDNLKKIIAAIDERDYMENTTFISFFHENLFRLKEMNPDYDCQALSNYPAYEELIKSFGEKGIGIDIAYPYVDENLMAWAKKYGVKVNAWIVDDPKECERLINLGIDYITSDIIE